MSRTKLLSILLVDLHVIMAFVQCEVYHQNQPWVLNMFHSWNVRLVNVITGLTFSHH
jgi:hypothetical protein